MSFSFANIPTYPIQKAFHSWLPMSGVKFDQKAITDAEEAYKKIEMAPEQKEIVEGIAKILCKFVPVTEMSMKGFISFVFRDYQLKEKTHVASISSMTPAERVSTVTTLFRMLKDRLNKVLWNKTDEEKISDAVDKALDFYKKTYANR